MGFTKEELAVKLREMYKEIDEHDMDLTMDFNDEKNAWVIGLTKGKHELTTHLEKKDADDCMNGIKCVYLGVQIGQFVQHFEEDEAKLG
ncbi:MAG: hypothetical protein Q8J63_09345 [Candidatus Aquicultor sp.]|nr:hypothetical protein [Candidatus Aquicultor sp.]